MATMLLVVVVVEKRRRTIVFVSYCWMCVTFERILIEVMIQIHSAMSNGGGLKIFSKKKKKILLVRFSLLVAGFKYFLMFCRQRIGGGMLNRENDLSILFHNTNYPTECCL